MYNRQVLETASVAMLPGDGSLLLTIRANCSCFTSKPAQNSLNLPVGLNGDGLVLDVLGQADGAEFPSGAAGLLTAERPVKAGGGAKHDEESGAGGQLLRRAPGPRPTRPEDYGSGPDLAGDCWSRYFRWTKV